GQRRQTQIAADATGQTALLQCPAALPCAEDVAMQSFRTCLSRDGAALGPVCQLGPGIHRVCSKLAIQRSDINLITGSAQLGPSATVIQRGAVKPPSEDGYLLRAEVNLPDLRVSYLTFDGNRYGRDLLGNDLGLRCLDAGNRYFDVELGGAGGTVTVEWTN